MEMIKQKYDTGGRWGWISILVVGLLLINVLYFLGYAVYNVYFHPLRKFPGSKISAATKIPYLKAMVSGRLPFWVDDDFNRYNSDVIRIAPDRLAIRAGDAWNKIHGHRTHLNNKTFDKDPLFYNRPVNGADSVITANLQDHSRQRRLLSHAFSDKALREQEPLIQSYVDQLVARLKEQIDGPAKGKVDMVKWYNYTTFDIIGDLAFGESFGCLSSSEYHPWVSNIFDSIKAAVVIGAIRHTPPVFMRLLSMNKSLQKRRTANTKFINTQVEKRLKLEVERPDFMSSILRHNDEKGMSVKEIESNAGLLIVAGSETTATLLSGCTYFLTKHPSIHKRLVEEIRSSFKNESDITLSQVSDSKYMMAVLEESLRMYPPVPVGMPRIVPKGGDTISGHFVPEGTVVAIFQYSTFRSEKNFASPNSFIPERWLDADSEGGGDARFVNDNKSALQPFSFGPRNCLGRNLAYSEMKLILSKLLWNYDITLGEESEGWHDQKAYNIWEKKPLMIKLTPRKDRVVAG